MPVVESCSGQSSCCEECCDEPRKRKLCGFTVATSSVVCLPILPGEQNWSSDFRVSFLHPRLVDLRPMASPAAVPKPRRGRGKVVLQDVDLLKSQRQKLKQDLKEMTRNLKLQLQKKRRIMRAANLMEDEDLHWLLKERERAKSNQAAQEEVNAEQNGVPE